MKKTLALLLALMMILTVSLTACSDKTNSNNGDDFDDDDDGFVIGNNTQTQNTDTDADTDTNNAGSWEAVSVTIYVLGNGLNIRSAADTKDSVILGKANIGDSFVATEADSKWYKISYEGTEAYVSAEYVTINQAEATFEDCEPQTLKIKNTVVDQNGTTDLEKYAKVMLRTDPVVNDTTATKNVLIYTDTTGDQLVKVAANKAGTWYKVTYNGSTYYIASGAFKYFEGYTSGNAGGLG